MDKNIEEVMDEYYLTHPLTALFVSCDLQYERLMSTPPESIKAILPWPHPGIVADTTWLPPYCMSTPVNRGCVPPSTGNTCKNMAPVGSANRRATWTTYTIVEYQRISVSNY